MKNIKAFICCLLVSSAAMAQNGQSDSEVVQSLQNEIILSEIEMQSEVAKQNIAVPQLEAGTEVDVEIEQNNSLGAGDLAVSNSRNLKILYVASSLFYTHNTALT